ncbi:hypothetical protein [Burkholderia ambifaria]|uniref:hypothetical protein n=1 Tax=Burkholderia ambifaria TaxID=152480 RepID=UPI001FC8A7F5|nr:hypothetical protein [Burkholderia ambifaria]
MFIVGDALGHERIASSLYSGRMLKSFPLGGAVRCGSRRPVLMRHALDDIQRFRAITVTLAANGPALPAVSHPAPENDRAIGSSYDRQSESIVVAVRDCACNGSRYRMTPMTRWRSSA